jgi:dTDP-4-dehydrorhamnose 3,5-epimerase
MELITLKNKDSQRLIKDLIIRPLKVNIDETGGILVETLRKDWPEIYGPGREFSMQYFSVTDSGLARDENVWHFHPTVQEDRFLVASGEVVVAVADNRDESETKGLLNLFRIKYDEDPFMVLIPKRTLHGFMVVSDGPATLLNFPTGLYNPTEEVRVPYAEAKVTTPDGKTFSWDLVREMFPNLKKP